jgi:hypothetical protein
LRLFRPAFRRFGGMLDRVVWQGTFAGRFEDKPFAIDVFNRHNDGVRQSVPPAQLLVFEVQEGWEPLCRFLDAPVPTGKPFPHVNDAAEFQARIKRVSLVFRIISFGGLALLALILAAVAALLFF